MPASSLIFVVIIAVWAAYLVQHWIRRRDHVATARSVDRFSEAMRVLERRQHLPRADLSTPAPRSYALSPARPAHPDVVVKRAASRLAVVPPPTRAVAHPRPAVTQPTVSDGPAVRRPGGSRAAARRVGSSGAAAAARRRGLALVVAVLVMALTVALGLTAVLPPWVPVLGIVALAATVAGLRVTAPSRRLRLRAAPAPVAARAATRDEGLALVATPRVTSHGESQTVMAASSTATAATTAPAAPVLYDIDAHEPREVTASEERETVQPGGPDSPPVTAEPGTWEPVPVPPPTYLLKSRAPRGAAAPAVAEPVGELPFDGHALALDEEYEELPAVHGLG